MTQPARTKGREQQNRTEEFYIWLHENMVQVGILLALVVGGVVILIVQDMNRRPKVLESEKPKSTGRDRQVSRYGGVECDKDPNCRQLKRIYAEGGASEEAIRKNLLAADESVTFEQLSENAARYEGTPWAFEGKIIDIIGQEKRGIRDYILADVIIGEDPRKQISVKGDFATDFVENDYVYVVGYITGTSHPRLGPNKQQYKGKVPSLSARALLKPSEARELLKGYGAN